MKLLITGASGFIGKYAVAEALRQGYEVRAAVGPHSRIEELAWIDRPKVEIVRIDLRHQASLVDLIGGVDAVIHLAAAKVGDFNAQQANTVVATQNLLDAMLEVGVHQLVAISTFSVYDYLSLKAGETLDEASPLEKQPEHRNVYAQTKLIQESIIRDLAARHQHFQVTILRPGMVYGHDNLWHALLGVKINSGLWIRVGHNAPLPLTYVENCAEAIVLAVQCDHAIGQIINIVDDNLPTQSEYINQVASCTLSPPRWLAIDWGIANSIAHFLNFINRKLLQNRAKLPGVFIPARLHARFKPLNYSNQRAKNLIDWHPKYSLEAAIQRSCSSVELLDTASSNTASTLP